MYALVDEKEILQKTMAINRRPVLQQLATIAQPGAILMIFDYTIADSIEVLSVKDFNDRAMRPIQLKSMEQDLQATGWQLLHVQDLTQDYIRWYAQFLAKLYTCQDELVQQYGQDVFNKVDKAFSYFYQQLQDNQMGGIILYLKKI